MHRRKRVTGQNERRNKVCRRDNNDEDDDNTLVISDSESDEEEDCATTVTSRTARRRERKKKAHVQDMTEDEMLDLALRLSKQEANCATQREQVEDDDMKKAIAESLQASCSQASKMSLKQIRSAAKPHKDQDTVSAHVRCKLSFTGRNEKDRVSTGDVKETQASAFKCSEDDGSLLTMPDLSQRTPSRPSPPSVRAATQESSSSLGCMEDGALDSESLLKCSPVFLRHCSVRLNPNVPSVSESVRNIPHSSVASPTRDRSQSSPLPSKSPVFPKTDSKRCSKLPRRKFSDGTSSASFTAGVHEPEDTVPESSSHECSDGDRPPKSDLFSPADSDPPDEFTSHMVLHLSDGDDGEESDKIIPPSPVFPQDRTSCAGQPKLLAAQPGSSSPKSLSQVQSEQEKVSRTSAGSRIAPAEERTDVGAVSYYWGIPFCPKGQSPDDYTKVILAQLEVYEKSLKEAQRQLLRKADWGFPVFPCPVEKPQGRRLKRHRAPRLLEEEEEEEEEGEEENETKKQVKQTEREESQSRSEDGAENGQHETYVVVSSPETQEELVKSPSQFKQRESTNTTKHSSRRKPLSQDLSDDTQIKSEPNEHVEEDQNGRLDVESAVCPETQMTEDNTPELMVTSPSQTDADVMELDEAPEPSAEADERMEQERPGEELTWTEPVSSRVECPMCTRLFPLGKIEMHAAYCNGTVEEQEQQESLSQGSARRRTVRKTAVEDDARFEKSEQQEKCYLCNKFFTSKEYSHHVDQCLQLKKAPGPKQGNGLLSALNRTETVDPATVYPNPVSKLVSDDSEAGPSNTTIGNNRNLTGGSVTPDGGTDYPGYYVSSSPIKSFTPISEIKDCLIDFKQQYPDRTSQRLGRKRKFKR